MCDSCTQQAINSHLLQRNGILNQLTENGHLMEIKSKDFFQITEGNSLEIKRIGINDAMSFPLFCNEHDTKIFKEIETSPINFDSYRTQVLFSYRTACSEIHKKQRAVEVHIRVVNSVSLKKFLNPIAIKSSESLIQGLNMGIDDIKFFKSEFEKEIINPKNRFKFFTYRFNTMKVCASGVFSPIKERFSLFSLALLAFHKKAWPQVYINLIPQIDCLILIIGFHKKYTTKWIDFYAKTWNSTDSLSLQLKLTDLIASRIETWCLSQSIYNSIPEETKRKFIDYCNDNITSFSENQEKKINFNLFENNYPPQ